MVFWPTGHRRFLGSGEPRAAGKPFKKMGGLRSPTFRRVSRPHGAPQTRKIDDARWSKHHVLKPRCMPRGGYIWRGLAGTSSEHHRGGRSNRAVAHGRSIGPCKKYGCVFLCFFDPGPGEVRGPREVPQSPPWPFPGPLGASQNLET